MAFRIKDLMIRISPGDINKFRDKFDDGDCGGTGCGGTDCVDTSCGATGCGGTDCVDTGCGQSGCGATDCVDTGCGLSGCGTTDVAHWSDLLDPIPDLSILRLQLEQALTGLEVRESALRRLARDPNISDQISAELAAYASPGRRSLGQVRLMEQKLSAALQDVRAERTKLERQNR